MLIVALFGLVSLVSNTNYQIIPLRFDLEINCWRQYQYFPPTNLTEDVKYNLTSEQMLEYMSLSLSNKQNSPYEQDFELILRAAKEKTMWAIKVLDA